MFALLCLGAKRYSAALPQKRSEASSRGHATKLMNRNSPHAQPDLSVRVLKLDPMRAARFHAFGPSPEETAWTRLRKWAEPLGLLQDPEAQVVGFNNPSPVSPDREYGYEFWIRISADLNPGPNVETLAFPGGWYAVMTQTGPPTPEAWMSLVAWVRQSPYQLRREHELERLHNPGAAVSDMVFDLCLPISPPADAPATPILVRGVDFVMHAVSNLAEAARFYREVLGLRQEMFSEEWHWAEFNCGNVTLALKGGEKPPVAGGARLALAVEDVPAACAQLRRQGVRVLGEPVDYGVCCAVEILDPDGNTLLLHHRADGSWGQGSGS